MATSTFDLAQYISQNRQAILDEWVGEQLNAATWRPDLLTKEELRQQSSEFLSMFIEALRNTDVTDIDDPAWESIKSILAEVSRSRALKGFTPSETATFIFSLKQPLFARFVQENSDDAVENIAQVWQASVLIDKLGLYTTEIFIQSRESLIRRQQQEMMELSTPVVKLWSGILALPLIGTLDSERTQMVMESLLQRIVETESPIVIIDITGVPTVDTLVAQHLIKTVSAARLMGSDCIISGIRPQIAQTIVHLGIELHEITTKATLADAFILALQRTGFSITKKIS
ncbi:MAG: STAS domain-containing protein [Anaerolineae bacterium]|nr:STAS domain-containing protein [Anaerolineae bacterium]